LHCVHACGCAHLLSPEMAAEASDRDTKDTCDVFLSHAGEQKKAYVDCLYQILVRMGWRGAAKHQQQCIEVFLDQHELQPGATAWAVIEEKARTCRIGGAHVHYHCIYRNTPPWFAQARHELFQSPQNAVRAHECDR
jgi:hypothetical protein